MDPSDFTLYESSPSRQPLPLCPGGGNESPTSVNQQNLLNPFPEARTAQVGWCFQRISLPVIQGKLETLKIA